MESPQPYPGDNATPRELLRLAQEYQRAAHHLLEAAAHAGKTPADSPWPWNAIHAIELYLNALLLFQGLDMPEIRGMHHDLAKRAARAAEGGFVLRRRTAAHLAALTSNREYLLARYEPGAGVAISQSNRLTATLDETAKKVAAKLASSG